MSEYDAPFTCVAEFEKTQLMAAVGSTGKREGLEKLYFNGTLEQYRALMGVEYAPKVEQTALF